MRLRVLLTVVLLAGGLGACADMGLSDVFSDDDDAAPNPNACTADGCPQAPAFCTARGYTPGTAAYQRCLVSVEQNLRKQP